MREYVLTNEIEYGEQIKNASGMITAMASDYRSVYYVDLDKDEGICYRSYKDLEGAIREGEHFCFSEAFTRYAEKYVAEGYRAEFLRMITPENIRKELENETIVTHRYLVVRNGQESYEMFRMAGVRHPEERDDHMIHAVGVGFTDVDKETRKTLRQQQLLSDALTVAEEANRAKTAFLSTMSHEIRTPMNAIIGLDTLALNTPGLSSETREYLEKIGASARHLLGLINDILDMSRIEAGRMVIKREEFSLKKLLDEINAMVDSQCHSRGLRYECRMEEDLPNYFIGDAMRLKQVIINILGNSVKFTPWGGSVIFSVKRIASFEGKTTLCFTMEDTGIGMDKEFIPKLYEAFSQEDSSTKNKYGSTGLGMAITRNFVEMMNGRIEVESEKGKGTTFTVTVTLQNSDHHEESEQDDVPLSGLSVLVVDDDPVALGHTRLMLGKIGITADTANTGAEAVDMARLRHARGEAYDLILMDWRMSEMNGIEATRRIRDSLGEEAAVVLLTGYQWEDIAQEAVEAGVAGFLTKPVAPANVQEEVHKALEKARSGRREKAGLNGRRILLAEDMPINAEIMKKILGMKRIEVEHAENGRIATEMFAEHPHGYYDAILMDMRMPEMDGLQAGSLIRSMDREDAKTIPIIALTANAFDEDVERSLQAGLNAHLTKPVEPDILFATLENLMK
ncbi:MAG: response regulator [Lachnospiraceae bacterium]|nr:response regulator [Lachnospiraceae bacterium]